MSENNKFDNSREPIEDIEKTVEELKRKIEEISAERGIEDSSDEKSAETNTKINEIKDSTIKKVNQGISDVKKAAVEVVNRDDLQKTIAYIKENARLAVETAKIRIDEIKNDEKIQSNLQDVKTKTSETFAKVSTAAKGAADTTVTYINSKLTDEQKASLKETGAKAGKVFNDTTKSVVGAVDSFLKKPEVQEFGKNAVDLAAKGKDTVKEFFNKKQGDDE